MLFLLAVVFGLLAFLASLAVLRHAFRRSLGTGVMVLLIPCYLFVYAFRQYEHPNKRWLLPGFLGCLSLAAVFSAVA